MSTAYVPQQAPHGGPGPMSHNGPQHQGGPPQQHPAPGPGMQPPQHGGTPNGVPMAPQRPQSHPGQQNPQNIQRVRTKKHFVILHRLQKYILHVQHQTCDI